MLHDMSHLQNCQVNQYRKRPALSVFNQSIE